MAKSVGVRKRDFEVAREIYVYAVKLRNDNKSLENIGVEGPFDFRVSSETVISYWDTSRQEIRIGYACRSNNHKGPGFFLFVRDVVFDHFICKGISPLYQYESGPLRTPKRILETGLDFFIEFAGKKESASLRRARRHIVEGYKSREQKIAKQEIISTKTDNKSTPLYLIQPPKNYAELLRKYTKTD